MERKNNKNYPLQQSCIKEDKREVSGLYVVYSFDLHFENLLTFVSLVCKYDKCNAKNNVNKVESKFFEFYDRERIYAMFKNKTARRSIMSTISSTSVTNPYINNTIPTTDANDGSHIQSTDTIFYLTLIFFTSYLILLT